jgi:radical SAM protein with 4Fe4S-binding SPASM domain
VDFRKLKRNICDARRKFKLKKIFFSGADILNYSSLPELITYVKEIGFQDILLTSNGVRLADKMLLDALVKAGVSRFDVPIYGHNERAHDSITGVRGSFKEMLKALKNLKRCPKVDLNLHTVLLKQNYSSIPRLYDFVTNVLKIHNFDARLAYPRNNDPKDYFTYCPPLSRIAGLIKNNASLKNAKFQLPFCVMPVFYLRKIFSEKPINEFLSNPNAEEKMLYVSQNGVQADLVAFEQTMMKPFKCSSCKLTDMCEGVCKSYTEVYGDKELRPFVSAPSFIQCPDS